MATDYDAPRVTDPDAAADESLEDIASRSRNNAATSVLDLDEDDAADSFELPDADLTGEELTVRVIPKQSDEFTCSSCFLVHHKHRLAMQKGNQQICVDCV